MKFKTLAIGLALGLTLAAPVQAQRGPGGNSWELLGQERVGIGADHDVIRLQHNEDFYRGRAYRRLRLAVEGGKVQMRTLRVTYINGHAEDIQVDRTLNPGQDLDVELGGERSYIRQIDLYYKGRFGITLGPGGLNIGQATVRVYGENVRAAPPPPPPPVVKGPGGWETIGSERFDRRDNRVEVRVGQREGRIGQIRLEHRGPSITIRDIRITFGNNETQLVRLNETLGEGRSGTRVIDVEGERRFIRNIVVDLEPKRRPGSVELIVLGTERPGRDDRPGFRPGPDWVPLGKKSVGFGVDRDVIVVGQREEFFRDRGFDKLHFAAEGSDLHLMNVRVNYLNGYGETLAVDRVIPAGSSLAVDLPGRRSYVRDIQLIYKARRNFSGRATISVWGEPASRR